MFIFCYKKNISCISMGLHAQIARSADIYPFFFASKRNQNLCSKFSKVVYHIWYSNLIESHTNNTPLFDTFPKFNQFNSLTYFQNRYWPPAINSPICLLCSSTVGNEKGLHIPLCHCMCANAKYMKFYLYK